MIDRTFLIGLVAAMTLIIVYNLYYQWRFGGYLEKQQEIQQLQEAEQKQTGAGEKKPEPAQLPGPEQPLNKQEVKEAVAPEGEARVPVATVPEPQAVSELDTATNEKTIRIFTGVTTIVLSNRGGVPIQLKLDRYRDMRHQNVNLIFKSQKYALEQLEFERLGVNQKEDASVRTKVYPTLGIKFPKDAFSKIINNAIFQTSATEKEVTLLTGDRPYVVTYEYEDASGVLIRKVYTFYPDDYRFDFEVLVKSSPKWGAFDYSLVWFGLGDEESDFRSFYSYNGPIVMINGERIAEPPEDDEPVREYTGEITWTALAHRYFTMFAIPEDVKQSTVRSYYLDDNNATLEWRLKARLDEKPARFRFFAGPKEHTQLEVYDNGIYSIINYGWFDILAKPLYWVMAMFYRLTGNWGWSIIFLTILTKGLFFPLSHKGFKSMQKLQKLQPHLKKLQETYKDDKEQLNKSLMALYKEHKVNPLGGCLPLVLQIPIFFALYKVLLESIELKGAGWILWIDDLSMRDPYYVTPVLMGVSMLGQQLMTPKTGDPMQRKMMMLLPVVFTFMFLTFPSGLVIYWLVNNMLTIGQQWIIHRQAK